LLKRPDKGAAKRFSDSSSQSADSLHAHLLFLAQSSRNLFSKIQRDLIARGIFCSVKDLDRKIMRYIRSYNRKATPIKWSHRDASSRIKTALELNQTVH